MKAFSLFYFDDAIGIIKLLKKVKTKQKRGLKTGLKIKVEIN